MSDVIKLIYTELDENSNKRWEGEVVGASVIYRWGRIGDVGQEKTKHFASDYQAQSARDKMVERKLAKGYTHQRTIDAAPSARPATNLRQIAVEQIDHGGDADTRTLIDFLVARNIHAIEGTSTVRYDASRGTFSTPLGLITSEGLDEAEAALAKISDIIASRSREHFTYHVSRYLRIIPTPIARRSPRPEDIFPNMVAVKVQYDLVGSLRQALDLAKESDDEGQVKQSVFNTKLTPVPPGIDFDKIDRRYRLSINQRHQSAHLKLKRAWGIEIGHCKEAFERDGAKLHSKMELWHGTKDANLLSILRSGYVIPGRGGNMRITGRMFGDGIYFSDQSTKSLNYATGFWGAGASQRAFMLLNLVAMGKGYVPPSPFSGGCRPGYDSTFAKAQTSGVMNNEMVVYRASQVLPLYLVEFS